MLTDDEKKILNTAIAAGHRAKATAGGRTILRTGRGARGYVVLQKAGGVDTPHGEHYYAQRGDAELRPDRRFDYNAAPYMKPGTNTEVIKDRTGREVRLRTLKPNGQDYTYTQAGKAYYSVKRFQYVVSIPRDEKERHALSAPRLAAVFEHLLNAAPRRLDAQRAAAQEQGRVPGPPRSGARPAWWTHRVARNLGRDVLLRSQRAVEVLQFGDRP
jgi:hypothetical protein